VCRALVVRNPWAAMIVRGVKRIEHRSWPTRHRGRLVIVAGCRKPTLAECRAEGVDPAVPCGALVGTVRVTGCRYNAALQCYEWMLADAVAFSAPVPFRRGSSACSTFRTICCQRSSVGLCGVSSTNPEFVL